MVKFRKKPVVIEAHLLEEDSSLDILEWIRNGGTNANLGPEGVIDIVTLEGTMRADLGDWIIQGVQGEFYPCKPDIFEQTYELA